MADGTRLTIASSPIYSPMFTRYCAMMRRSDLLADPRYATARLRRENLASLLAEVRAWLATFDTFEQLQAQVSESGLAVGRVRTVGEFANSDWVKEWNAVVDVDDRGGGTLRMPGNPWIFGRSELPRPGAPAYQGEHNEEILRELQVPEHEIRDLEKRSIIFRRR
jgi:crotonobetainyl-CoA:carnitine CoA-transferase CaiB-like acyl-CoA transferase